MHLAAGSPSPEETFPVSVHPDASGSTAFPPMTPLPRPRLPEPDPALQRSPHERWQVRYAFLVTTVDLTVLVVCLVTAIALGVAAFEGDAERAHIVAGVVAAALVLSGLVVARAWEPRVLGIGSEELRRLGSAVTGSAVLLALGGLALQIDSVRPWV